MTEFVYRCTTCCRTRDPGRDGLDLRAGVLEYEECDNCVRLRKDSERWALAYESIAASCKTNALALEQIAGSIAASTRALEQIAGSIAALVQTSASAGGPLAPQLVANSLGASNVGSTAT